MAHEEVLAEVLAEIRAALPAELLATAPSRVFACAHRVGAEEVSALVPHANNIVILGWIDRIAELHGAHAGAARETVAREGRMWFVARHEIDYLGESFVGDELVIATWIEKLGRTSLTRTTVIAKKSEGVDDAGVAAVGAQSTILVRASSRWAFVDLATRRPAAIPEDVRRALMGE
jgi:acyl-CoA thioester hydrolase